MNPKSDLILDWHQKINNWDETTISYPYNLHKDELSRKYVLEYPGTHLNFLDVGAFDGKLTNLFTYTKGMHFPGEDSDFAKENRRKFYEKYNYYGMDIREHDSPKVLTGDICGPGYLEDKASFIDFFDVIYSNNVFEHLHKPWHAAENITKMLKTGGLCITVVPFSQRYHAVPDDYFRYTHNGMLSLFEEYGNFEVLATGYDTSTRRVNWQGISNEKYKDILPVDEFGAWRETWFTVTVLKKVGS